MGRVCVKTYRVSALAKVVRVRYEKGVLRPLEDLGLSEGEELTVVVKGRSFYELVRRLQVEAREDVDSVIAEVRGRGKKLYG